jgi:hypothetical protein
MKKIFMLFCENTQGQNRDCPVESETIINNELRYDRSDRSVGSNDQHKTDIENNQQKYVDAENHYIVTLAADTIYSYFQDKFATTNYLICVGDNSSGKNPILMDLETT